MQSKGGGIIKQPLKKGISKVFKKITRRRNAANPTGLRLKNPNVRTKRPASSGHKNRMHNISQRASGGLKKFNKSMGSQDLSKLKPTTSKWGGDKAGGGFINKAMRNPAVARKYQLEGFANVPLAKMAKDGIQNVGAGRKISTTQAEARKGAFAKKPLPMPFPMMAGGGNIAARAGQYMGALMDDSIEFGSGGIARLGRKAKGLLKKQQRKLKETDRYTHDGKYKPDVGIPTAYGSKPKRIASAAKASAERAEALARRKSRIIKNLGRKDRYGRKPQMKKKPKPGSELDAFRESHARAGTRVATRKRLRKGPSAGSDPNAHLLRRDPNAHLLRRR